MYVETDLWYIFVAECALIMHVGVSHIIPAKSASRTLGWNMLKLYTKIAYLHGSVGYRYCGDQTSTFDAGLPF